MARPRRWLSRWLLPLVAAALGATPMPAAAGADSTQRSSGASAATVESTFDIEFASRGGAPLHLDVHAPTSAEELPALILIHGGRWTNGNKADITRIAQRWAGFGYVVFNIEYRLAVAETHEAPGVHHPAQLDDVRSAVAWVGAHGVSWGADPANLALLGASAGGHLALLAAMQDPAVDAVASWSGPTDLAVMWSKGQETRAIGTFLGCTHPEPCPVAGGASPRTHVTADDPPTLLANGTAEAIPAEQAELMAGALEGVNVPHELHLPTTEDHAWGLSRYVEAPTRSFFARNLCGPGTGPTASVDDLAVAESSGSAVLGVELSEPTCRDVTVSFATADGTAEAGSDYARRTGGLRIPAGATAGTISVPVLADDLPEPDETFRVVLSDPQGAELADGQATVTILGEAGTVPTLSVADSSTIEGDAGSRTLTFLVTLSEPATEPVKVAYTSVAGTAVAGRDYLSTSGTITIPAGSTEGTIEVVVLSDERHEPNETLALIVSSATNAEIDDDRGTGVIVNDDTSR